MTLVSVCVHFLKLLDTQRHRNGHRARQLIQVSTYTRFFICYKALPKKPSKDLCCNSGLQPLQYNGLNKKMRITELQIIQFCSYFFMAEKTEKLSAD